MISHFPESITDKYVKAIMRTSHSNDKRRRGEIDVFFFLNKEKVIASIIKFQLRYSRGVEILIHRADVLVRTRNKGPGR